LVKFAPGEVLVRRYWRGGRLQRLYLVRVAADDDRGLRLWMPAGSPWWRVTGPDEEAADRDASAEGARARLVREVWSGPDVLIWLPEQTPYAVSWLWDDGSFAGWRATLEEPSVRWADRGCAGVDTADHGVELVVRPDYAWRWQARDTGSGPDASRDDDPRTDPAFDWATVPSPATRANGERVVKLVEARAFPFDGTWRGFRPDASWTVPALPHGYDRPRAVAVRT
jgi:hypothetical protein